MSVGDNGSTIAFSPGTLDSLIWNCLAPEGHSRKRRSNLDDRATAKRAGARALPSPGGPERGRSGRVRDGPAPLDRARSSSSGLHQLCQRCLAQRPKRATAWRCTGTGSVTLSAGGKLRHSTLGQLHVANHAVVRPVAGLVLGPSGRRCVGGPTGGTYVPAKEAARPYDLPTALTEPELGGALPKRGVNDEFDHQTADRGRS